MSDLSVVDAIESYLDSIQSRRSVNTLRTYTNALDTFLNMLKSKQINVPAFLTKNLNEDHVIDFVVYTKKLSPSTESLYLQVIRNFFEYLNAEHMVILNISRVRLLIKHRTRRLKVDNSNYYPEDKITYLIEQMAAISEEAEPNNKENNELLRDLRDSALILTLADTGLRVDEVCKLKISDIDWSIGKARVSSKGKKQNIIRFSTRSMNAVKKYFEIRKTLYIKTDNNPSNLPVFSRHDKGSGNKIKPITTTTIRNIVSERVDEIVGIEIVGKITPHTFLHYFVTTILRKTGNLKLAQELARQSNIQVTQRYAHLSDDELDKGYYEIFERKD